MKFDRRWLTALTLLLTPLLALWRCLILSETVGPFGLGAAFGLKGVSGPARPLDLLQLDGVLQFTVWRDLVLSAWHRGEMPLWNPYVLSGTPLLANSQSGALYPPHIVLGWLGIPTAWAIFLLAWAHLSWAALGSYNLVRLLGANRSSATLIGATIGLSNFMLSWLPLASVVTTLSWIPWIAFGMATAHSGQAKRGAAWVALSVGMLLLSGHLQFASYGLMLAVLCLLGIGISTRSAKSVGWAGLGILVGGIIGWSQLSAVLSFSKFSHRANIPTEEGYAAYSSTALWPVDWANVVSPNALGNPTMSRTPESDQVSLSSYWPQAFSIPRPSGNYAESALTLGVFVWIGLFFAPWRKLPGLGVALGVVALLSVALASGSPLNRLLYFAVPGWSATGSPGRSIVLFVLCLSWISALGWSKLLGEPLEKKDVLRRLGAALVLAILFTALPPSLLVGDEIKTEALAPLIARGTLSGLTDVLIGFAIIAAALYLGHKKPTLRAASVLGAMAVVALSQGILTKVPTGSFEVQKVEGHKRMIVKASDTLYPMNPPNWSAMARQFRADGYDSLIHRETVQELRRINGGADPAVLVNGNMMVPKNPVEFRGTGIAEVVDPVAGTVTPTGESRATLNGKALRISSESLNFVELDAPEAGELALYDRNMPGWQATLDGKPLVIKEGIYRMITLSAPGKVRFTYWPFSIHPFLFLGFGLLCVMGLFAASTNSKRNDQPVSRV